MCNEYTDVRRQQEARSDNESNAPTGHLVGRVCRDEAFLVKVLYTYRTMHVAVAPNEKYFNITRVMRIFPFLINFDMF